MQCWKLYKIPLLLSVLSSILYWFFAYDLVRTDETKLLLLYSFLWLCFLGLLKFSKGNFRLLKTMSFLFRAIFIFSIPNLSQDFYRFIWDGRMILEGFNPYLYTPESFISSLKFPIYQAKELYDGMGELNGSHFTNYPPINQLCFVVAALFAGKSIWGSVIIMRIMIIGADLGILFLGKRLLKSLKLSETKIFWYLLNPFIIIELTGNLHFESVMLIFLLWSLYLIYIGKWQLGAFIFALSVSVKLIPLLFLPLFLRWFVNNKEGRIFKKLGKLLIFYSIIIATTGLLFIPFFSMEFVDNYAATVGLWFQKFEFNASFYYIAREIGYSFRGYNEIAIIGKIMAALVFSAVLLMSLFRKNEYYKTLITSMLLAFGVYLFLSTTVHPWYLATLLLLSVFTNFRFPMVWTFTIVLSYLAYSNSNNSENLWIIALEYGVVFGVLINDLFRAKRKLIG